jgi:hypothetical protein
VPNPSKNPHLPKKKLKESVEASIEEQLDQMLSAKHVGKVYPKLEPLNLEDEPLIDNIGVRRVLNRGAIVVLSREYHDLEEVKRREEERLKAHQDDCKESIFHPKRSIGSMGKNVFQTTRKGSITGVRRVRATLSFTLVTISCTISSYFEGVIRQSILRSHGICGSCLFSERRT